MPTKRVMIVEDHKENSDAIADFIRFVFTDWDIEQVAKGALAVKSTLESPPDVMVLDIALADEVNGMDVIRKLWEGGVRSKPRIVVVTALGNKAFRGPKPGQPWIDQLKDDERSLVHAFFEKPYSWRDFLTTLAKAADVPVPDKVNLIPEMG